ncbi:unnamed protein product [Urochloa humidicola]
MASKLRSAIGRAASLLGRFRGPRPDPAAAPSAAEVDLLSKKADDANEKRWIIEFAESLVEEQKKKYESHNQDWVAVRFFTTLSFAALFVAGNQLGHDHGKRMYETQSLEESLEA